MYREWSPDGSRDGKRVSGKKSWDSDGTLTALVGGQGKTRHETALQIKKYIKRKDKRDKERDPHSLNSGQERRSDAGRDRRHSDDGDDRSKKGTYRGHGRRRTPSESESRVIDRLHQSLPGNDVWTLERMGLTKRGLRAQLAQLDVM
jgi:hypothetical protein